jgi:voltage-gated potassium channel
METSRQDRWSARMNVPLVLVALIFTVAYAWDIIGDLSGPAHAIAEFVIWTTWGAFVIDFVVKLALAERRMKWFFLHFLDFLLVALPFLRPLRLLRVFTLWSVMQRIFGQALRGKIVVYVIGSGALLVFIGALAALEAERHAPGAKITTFGDSLWWSFETISTIGYGDYEPVTFEGRVVAVGLMIAGIALLGAVTATLAAWLVSTVGETEVKEAQHTQQEIAELAVAVHALREELAATRAAAAAAPVTEVAAP